MCLHVTCSIYIMITVHVNQTPNDKINQHKEYLVFHFVLSLIKIKPQAFFMMN